MPKKRVTVDRLRKVSLEEIPAIKAAFKLIGGDYVPRFVYRGSRKDAQGSMTLKRHATHATMYLMKMEKVSG